ncbi:GNAT family N-acetyltransferase [Urechidicola vernalis]|uniref:GNAT family protein n=1 Tax=Urechidicola vernalis TaxID=3075600 RepID=A0ABU2Y971_9FLAO|nr:GNAT family protein [Urechidicola sp. P050]MDT0554297.1 GNAT family protein [Urechidicola sp. P050]
MQHSWLEQITLKGSNVSLVPLTLSHRAGLLNAASDGELWNLWFTSVPSEKNIDSYLETALNNGHMLPFTVKDANGKIIGSTRFCNSEPNHLRLEIGHTWYAKSTQRTGVNTECKLLLLTHAFEVLNCNAVEFRTHYFNTNSRNAIARLGAKQDGILRNHRMDKDGALRDTVVFSILKSEWPVVKKHLNLISIRKLPIEPRSL